MSAKSDFELQMQQQESFEQIDQAMKELEKQQNELADAGAEALDAGDTETLDMVCSNICYVTEQMNMLRRYKINTKVQLSNVNITNIMIGVFDVMAKTTKNGVEMPNTRKLMKIQKQMLQCTAKSKAAKKQIGAIMNRANPATNTSLTSEERAQAMLLVQARRNSQARNSFTSNVFSEAREEKKNQN